MNKEMEAEVKALGARLPGGIPVFKGGLEDYLWSSYGIIGISVSKSFQDIWDWQAPFNSLKSKDDPMILVLRMFQIDRNFRGEVVAAGNRRYGIIQEQLVNIVGDAVVLNDDFEEIKKTVLGVLGSRLR